MAKTDQESTSAQATFAGRLGERRSWRRSGGTGESVRGVAGAIAVFAALISSWWMPHEPLTSTRH